MKNDTFDKNINNSYLKFTFKGNNLHINNDPTIEDLQAPVLFTMKGKLAKTSRVSESGYMIEKISKDSLILSDSFNSGAKRYFFINNEILKNESLKKNDGKEILITTKYHTPVQRKSISNHVFDKIKNGMDGDFYIEGTIKLNLEEKKVETIILSDDLENKKKLAKITELINKTYDFWDVSGFEKFKIIELPFQLIGTKNEMIRGVRIAFF
ncbi:hypothetical protein FLJC2902T_19100 [Flavobacterium limnosediminis JC2902]|uniref:Uncharacterized protein n=2 Tax=Flavobacterium TaxID=237 RepID=V6SQQ5_9FLAO|nr:hypothetical protein FLJC2902T_19100 [Flavobacterium limnosediminis JC2902]